MQGRVPDSLTSGSLFLFNYFISFCLIVYIFTIKWVQPTSMQMKHVPEMLCIKKYVLCKLNHIFHRFVLQFGRNVNPKHITKGMSMSCWAPQVAPHLGPEARQVTSWAPDLSPHTYSHAQLIPKWAGSSHCSQGYAASLLTSFLKGFTRLLGYSLLLAFLAWK